MDRAVFAGPLLVGGILAVGCLFDPTGSAGATAGGSTGASSSSSATGVTTGATGETTQVEVTSTSTSTGGSSTGGETTTTGAGSSTGSGLNEPHCGDGKVDPGNIDTVDDEECDDGDLINENACTNLCKLQICGDGFLDLEHEQCDGGGAAEAVGCDKTCKCTLKTCGDGKIDPAEECDDGNAANRDSCSACCQRLYYNVFVSSKTFVGGGLKGLEAADGECTELATKAGLPGAYQAWLGPSRGLAKPLLTTFKRPYALPTGVIVAHSLDELHSGTLSAAIDVDETGKPLGPIPEDPCADPNLRVWTGTDKEGFTAFNATCEIWTNAPMLGRTGAAGATDATWADCQQDAPCTSQARLYCFEVQPG